MFSTAIKYLTIVYLISSYKTLPGAYFIRFYYHVCRLLFKPYFTGKETLNIETLQKSKYGCFAHSKYSTYASPWECDLYFHKNNSTYFSELDISRGELMLSIFQKLFLKSKKWPYVPVANVFTNFLKEISPFERYNVTSQILCWDEKWIYVLSKFTKNNDKILCSISLTKYVLKDGRKTIKPKDALEVCGLYNADAAALSEKNLKILVNDCGFHETGPLEEMTTSNIQL
ncbi:hypothetical protein TBLA_0B02530 [Henningerozyma blattae CBS 6284]|uniref:Thioesterase domain-containing protein n=1 Tax=Henningerozyma blattae (strain ATCC 34711 / CBS 6284 / DSM 70876 / NBRC 10599 / NRRL Y-10934 / UCD 77-7) TaxID=1071380 RepID=I2GY93_HENB6|nr:hypothetical protein TBLA_0B02530 [Tetrapisispora blattae CBS 6284]CCH59095.1 hypothetical protein TBLA_0B02530 [Tetrapisispora blattae CBS 6284]